MTQLLRPRAFEPGRHKIGLFSPSSHISGFPRRLARAIRNLERRCRGVIVAPGACDRLGDNAGAAKVRAAQIRYLLNHEEVGLLMATTGGYGCFGLLAELDLADAARSGKPIVGYSDLTTLLVPLTAGAGLISFHGPMALPDFGEAEPADYTWRQMIAMVAERNDHSRLAQPDLGSDDFRLWERDDDDPTPLLDFPPPTVVAEGSAEGPLFGGNIDVLVALTGGRYGPPSEGSLLFLETAFGSWEKLERDLLSLDAAGLFERAAGLVFGRLFQVAGADESLLRALLTKIASRHRFPCVTGFALGHSTPVMTLPLGARARLETDPVQVSVLERTVV
jgi:muramoyltetrapeptide carboxypeptidase